MPRRAPARTMPPVTANGTLRKMMAASLAEPPKLVYSSTKMSARASGMTSVRRGRGLQVLELPAPFEAK
jgi:hypothetical protein